MKVWRMREKRERARLKLEEGVSGLVLHRDSGLLAVAARAQLLVVDLLTLRVVRRLHEALRTHPSPFAALPCPVLPCPARTGRGVQGSRAPGCRPA